MNAAMPHDWCPNGMGSGIGLSGVDWRSGVVGFFDLALPKGVGEEVE